MSKKNIKFMCTAFRDGFQSVYGARVLTKDFLPAVEAARDAGINWFEAGGGARFQALYFYCNEDAFAMMDAFRNAAGKDAELQTLSRGINVVGLESQSSDVIKMHADLFHKHGISAMRNFDALNDINNIRYSAQCIKDAGLKHQVSISMMGLPPSCSGAHDPDFYEKTLKNILDAEIPFDSVCFKDASGTALPKTIFETVKRARNLLGNDVMIHYHTHESSGMAMLAYMAAIEAGANAVDLSLSPLSGGSCQPDIATLWNALRGTDFSLDIDIQKVLKAEEVLNDCMAKYFFPPEAMRVEPNMPWSPLPGGALTANTQMLRDNGMMDKFHDISVAMGDVVKKGGFGTSVTPVSQFYFQQAFNNVIFGEWQKIADGFGKMVLGYFGKTPVEPDAEIVKIAAEQLKLEPTTKTPLEINDADETKGLDAARKLLEEASLPITDENLFIVATCKDKGITYLKGEAKVMVRYKEKESAACSSDIKTISINNQNYCVKFVQDGVAEVNGKTYNFDIQDGKKETVSSSKPTASAGGASIVSPMPGTMWKILLKAGDAVKAGDVIMILESMKMEIEIKATVDGTISKIMVSESQHITTGQELAKIG
ncbi:MAG: biotin/lipoyl-containing protein [Alphaproteobacteria bacterium]